MAGPQAPNVKYPALQLGIASAVSGTVGAFAHESHVDPLTMVFWRCFFGACFLLVWSVIFRYLDARALRKSNVTKAAAAGAFLAFCWICLFTAFQMTSIATATLVFQIYPFLLVLAGVIILREAVTWSQCIWLLLAFAGVALASGALDMPQEEGKTWLLGIGLTLIAATSYVGTTMFTRVIRDQRPEVTMMFQAVTGAVILSFLANFHQHLSLPSWGWLMGMGVIHSGLVMVAIYATYPHLRTPVIAVMNFIYPAVAILLDWLIYDHPLSTLQILGTVLIALATLGINLKWSPFSSRDAA